MCLISLIYTGYWYIYKTCIQYIVFCLWNLKLTFDLKNHRLRMWKFKEHANHHQTFQVPKMQESSPIYIYKLYGYGLWIQENPPPKKSPSKWRFRIPPILYRYLNLFRWNHTPTCWISTSTSDWCKFPHLYHLSWHELPSPLVERNQNHPQKKISNKEKIQVSACNSRRFMLANIA